MMGSGSPKFRCFGAQTLHPSVALDGNSSLTSKSNLLSPGLEYLSLCSLLLYLLDLLSLLGKSGPSIPCVHVHLTAHRGLLSPCACLSPSYPEFSLCFYLSAHEFQTLLLQGSFHVKEPAGAPTQVPRGPLHPCSYLICSYLYLLSA